MTTIIANPIYDAVFKFLMEDNKVAKLLLSALLKKEIIELDMRRHEYSSMEQSRISLFRIDFCARVRDADGKENLILIELQKTWLITETLRFRQYLGTQYLDKENVIKEKRDNSNKEISYGMPIVSIYILGHCLSDLKEPVIYVRRNYLDYDENALPGPDRFIESLTHDSIIVQIPLLTGRTRNRLERMLSVFDQVYCMPNSEHYLEINDDAFASDDVQYLVHRLLKAASTPDVRRAMEVEDEILSEIEDRDTKIMVKDQEIKQRDQELEQRDQELGQKEQELEQKKQVIEQRDQELGQKDQELEQKKQVIEQRDQELGQKEQELEQKEQVIEQSKQVIEQSKQVIEQKEQELEQKDQELEQKEQMLCSMIKMLCKKGISPEAIAAQLSMPIEQIQRLMRSVGE